MAHDSVSIPVPFLDLKAQYACIKPEIDEAVHSVLDSTRYVAGEWVGKFEAEFAAFVGTKHAVGVGSGTAALELALKAANIGPSDEVIVPANSFIATAEAVSNIGAKPVFADVAPSTSHVEVASIERAITNKTRAIIPVHLYGRAMDLTEIEAIAAAHHLEIIEDAAQAHGSRRGDIRVGGSGRLTCFSFYPAKNLGAYGEAGAVTCEDDGRARVLRLLRDHGSQAKHHHSIVGTNARLDSIQAAVLSVKLRHLSQWNEMRVHHAKTLAAALGGSLIRPPQIPPEGEHNFHLFVVRTEHRDRLRSYLENRGIGTGIHYPVPLHLTEAYQALGYPGAGSAPVSESLAEHILSLPMYPELSAEQVGYLVGVLEDYAEHIRS